jgi:hypothetical protein
MAPFVRYASEVVARWLLIPESNVLQHSFCRVHVDECEPAYAVEGVTQKLQIPVPPHNFAFIEMGS